MIAEIIGGTIFYRASTGDWLANIRASGAEIEIEFNSNTGSMEMSSGTNYDNLVSFIGEVKADAISRGVNWSGN
jgi:hypothetical protein